MNTTSTDSIRNEILIKAPRSKVWKAVSDPAEFGAWFKVDMTGVKFEPGSEVHATMTYPGHEGSPFEAVVDRVEAPRLFSFRWWPYQLAPEQDRKNEPATLVEFVLEEVDGGTMLTVIESGFDSIPASYRAASFRNNSEGWTQQMLNIEAYVTAAG